MLASIEGLKRLLDSGAIEKEDFTEKKAEMLARI